MRVRVALRVARPGAAPVAFDAEAASPDAALAAADAWLAALPRS